MFNYEVLTEQEAMAERFQLLKEGEYDALITSSMDKTSTNSGNPMMDMTVTVYDEKGKSHDIRDFLVFTKPMMWKIVHFSDSAGISKEYQNGVLCSKYALNKHVKVKVGIEEGRPIPAEKLNGKSLGSKYQDKNKIEDYLSRFEDCPL
jgi:hypothetical protein